MIDASGLRHHIRKGREGSLAHLVIPLVGSFKGVARSRHHLQAVVNKISSKLKVRRCMESFTYDFIRKGHSNGPVCCD